VEDGRLTADPSEAITRHRAIAREWAEATS